MYQYSSSRLIDETIMRAAVFAVISAVVGSLYLKVFTSKKSYIPRIGKDPGVFSLAATREDFLKRGHKLIKEGYDKVCVHQLGSDR